MKLNAEQRRALDRAKEKLVVAAETLLNEAGVVDLPKKDFGHSQLRNLIAVATETESPAVVLNFIKYQMGRDGKQKKNWAKSLNGKPLGERFLGALGERGVVAECLKDVPGLDGEPVLRQLARIVLIRHFLGFASRYLKFLDLQRPGRDEEAA